MKETKELAHVRSCMTAEPEDQSFHREVIRRLMTRPKFSAVPKSGLTAKKHDPSREQGKARNKS